MATIAEQLTSLAETKTAIKDAIVAKGVEVADTDTFRSYADKIGQIQAGGGEPATKFGASVDTWVGDVDENGVLQATTWTGALNFAGVREIGDRSLFYAFYRCAGITGVDFSSLQSVGTYGLSNAFQSCTGITSADFSSLQNVGSNGLSNVFYDCEELTSADFSSLTTVGYNGLYYAFRSCKKLTTMSFPSLTNVQSSSLSNAFSNCTALTEIHFRADMQATIEGLTGYSSKFGATNATIYFSL
jgi:hypothetical protein